MSDPPFSKGGGEAGGILNGQPVAAIYADLTGCSLEVNGGGVDLTQAKRLVENAKISFMGITKSGPFDISGDLARVWLKQPNPHGKPNSDVLFPSVNGQDLAQRLSDSWIIHFGERNTEEAALYESPYKYALCQVKPERLKSKTPKNREIWWRFERSRPEMFKAFGEQIRYIATSMVAKHRFFVWLNRWVIPENVVIVIARSDDITFGILHSRFHELWALRTCTWLGKGNDPRYTPTTCFETFPFPAGLAPNIPATDYADDPRAQAIADAARRLNELRENWLNPPEWVERVPEISPRPLGEGSGVKAYPDRLIPKPEHAAELKKRTLTNLYNQRPAWLVHTHRALDQAVTAAYGWPADLSDDEILRRLLALNRARAAEG
jgi:type II restriction/modification system DNA methylase subunit YeeA